MKKATQNKWSYIIIAFVLGYLWFRIEREGATFVAPRLDFILLLKFFVAFLFVQVVQAYKQKVFLRTLDVNATFSENFHMTNSMMLGNQLPMSLGLVANWHYLRSNHGLSSAKFLSYVAADAIIKIAIYSVICMLLGIYFVQDMRLKIIAIVFFALAIGFMLSISILNKSGRAILNRWIFLEKFVEGMHAAQRRPQIFALISLLNIASLYLVAWRLILVAQMFDESLSLTAGLFMSAAVLTIRMASLLPGNIGLREALIAEIFHMSDGSYAIGIHIGALDRVCTIIILTILGTVGFLYLQKRARSMANLSQ